MDDETLGKTFFPSMQPKGPERISRTEGGEAMIPFKMDDEAAALSRQADEQEEKARRRHQHEVENIRRHGPLNRLTERVIAEGEEGDNDSSVQPSAEEQELRSFAESGDFDALAERIRGDLEEIGATDDDIAMVDYFKDIVERTGDPAWKRWAVEMALWSRRAAGAARR